MPSRGGKGLATQAVTSSDHSGTGSSSDSVGEERSASGPRDLLSALTETPEKTNPLEDWLEIFTLLEVRSFRRPNLSSEPTEILMPVGSGSQ